MVLTSIPMQIKMIRTTPNQQAIKKMKKIGENVNKKRMKNIGSGMVKQETTCLLMRKKGMRNVKEKYKGENHRNKTRMGQGVS